MRSFCECKAFQGVSRQIYVLLSSLRGGGVGGVGVGIRPQAPSGSAILTIIERAILEPSIHLHIIFEHFCSKCENFVFYSLQMRLPDVGSSKKSTEGRLIICRAMHRRRFCPPLSPGPTDPPTTVSARDTRPVWKEINRFTPYSKLFLVHSTKKYNILIVNPTLSGHP